MNTWQYAALFLAVGGFLVGTAASVHAQQASTERPGDRAGVVDAVGFPLYRNYTPADYGADLFSQNWSVTQDDQGIIYVANPGGVLAYDGERWRLITTDRQTLVRTLVRDKAGRVYVGAYGEIGVLQPDSIGTQQFESLVDEIDPALREFGHTWSGAATSRGVYFQTRNLLFRWNGAEMKTWRTGDEARFYKVFSVRDTLYVAQENVGLRKMVDGELVTVEGGDRFADAAATVVLPYGPEGLLVGTVRSTLHVRTGAGFTPFEPEADRFLRDNELHDGVVLPDGTYAFATLWGGVVVVDEQGRTVRLFDEAAGLVDNDVKSLFVDRRNGLWMTSEKGITRAELTAPLSLYDDRAGLDGLALSLTRHRGVLHVGTSSGIFRLQSARRPDGTRGPQFRRVPFLRGQTFSMASTPWGLLAATDRGVFSVEGNRVNRLTKGRTAFSVYRSRTDTARAYVGYIDGIGRLTRRNGRWVSDGRIPGLEKGIFLLEEDRDGNLWASSAYSGLWWIQNPGGPAEEVQVREMAAEGQTPQHVFRMVHLPQEGLRIVTRTGLARPVMTASMPDSSAAPNPPTSTVSAPDGSAPDGSASEASATDTAAPDTAAARSSATAGVLRRPRLVPDTTLTARLPEAVDRILSMDVTADGDIWFVTRDATYWLRRGDRTSPRHSEGEVRPVVRRPLAPVSDFNVYATRAEPGGTYWIVGENGVLRHAPLPRSSPPPKPIQTQIRRVLVPDPDSLLYGGQQPDASAAADTGAAPERPTRPVLDDAANSVRIEYAAAGFGTEDEIEYRYRLQGFDEKWSDWTAEAHKEYTNLPPGTYTFVVEARTPGVWTADPARYAFTVLPPWYRTGWAYGIYGLLAAGLVAALVTWRTAHLNRRKERLEEIVAERTAEVEKQARQLETINTELLRSNEDLQEAIEEKSKLLGVAAHDLKNPIYGIRALSEVALKRVEENEYVERKLTLIQSMADETLGLITDLLASAASTAQTRLDLEPVDVVETAEWVVHSFQPQAERKDQTIRSSFPEDPCRIQADKRKLREAMSNLVSNAIKYSPYGAPVTIVVEKTNRGVRFRVADEGPGLSPEDQNRMFAPFQRLTPSPTGDEGSSGLGLYIVKNIVELHDGTIHVHSERGTGSIFEIVLPASPNRARRPTYRVGDAASGSEGAAEEPAEEDPAGTTPARDERTGADAEAGPSTPSQEPEEEDPAPSNGDPGGREQRSHPDASPPNRSRPRERNEVIGER